MSELSTSGPGVYTGGGSKVLSSSTTPSTRPMHESFSLGDMMTWLTLTMQKSDAAIRMEMAAVNGKKDLSAKIGEVLAALSKAENTKAGSDSGRECRDVPNIKDYASQDWFKQMPAEMQNAFASFAKDVTDGGDTIADQGAVKAARESLTQFASTLTSSNEIAMIKLQSGIAARGQALQLVSNMMNSFNETSNRIIGNVK